jgi:hypothetical protein
LSVEEWALIASVVFTGLFSGLYGMLNTIFHKVMGAMDGPELARFLRAFLPVARRAPFNYACVIGMILAPAVALIATDDAGGTPFVLTAIGLALTLGLAGGSALLLQAQLDQSRVHLDGIRPVPRGLVDLL